MNKEMHYFIENINNYNISEIVEKIEDIFKEISNSDISFDDFLNLAIKTVKDIKIKALLLKSYFTIEGMENFNTYYYWNNIISILKDLKSEDRIFIFRFLFNNLTFESISMPLNIPNNLKFGIELEYTDLYLDTIKQLFSNGMIDDIMKALSIPEEIILNILNNYDFEVKNEFNKWIFSREITDSCPEISTPILCNNTKSIDSLNAIVLLFNALGANTGGRTGLHINIGVDFFANNPIAIKYLLIIWSECEELFYKIANEENIEIRYDAINMAIPIKKNIQKTLKENKEFEFTSKETFGSFLFDIQVRERLKSLTSYEDYRNAKTTKKKILLYRKYLDYCEKINMDSKTRYTSVNFNHMSWYCEDKGRIEFRLFNSSLSFDVVLENILLVSKLCETCLSLASENKKYNEFSALLNHQISEEEKLDLLLDLLFDSNETKEIFRQRYNSVKDNDRYKSYQSGEKTYIKSNNRTI